MNEPDHAEWTHRGVPCFAIRVEMTGTWCGYVVPEPGHPWHGKGFDDEELRAVNVHRGVSWARTSSEGPRSLVIREEHWVVGFDCCHAFDFMPGMRAHLAARGCDLGPRTPLPGEAYRDLAYVREQTNEMAEQLIAARRM